MWDLVWKAPFGRISKRNSAIFATIVMVASFALTLLIAPTALAADATWQGSAISYASKQFVKVDPASAPGLPAAISGSGGVYAYIEPVTSGASNPTQKAHLIYFATGTDPTTATSANYVTFDFTPPSTYANQSTTTALTIDPAGTGASAGGITSCAYEGIGWIVCPLTNFLAGAMDWMFDVLSTFLTVRPVQTTSDNALFRMWSVMRNFANVLFVIGFLIVIYSQVTGTGISSYGIKRILPRLILVAIAVNVSYWLCAIAIDASNIAGHSIQQLFINLRNTMVGTEGNSWDIKWESMAGFVLSGGTAVTIAAIGVHSLLGASVTGALYMLLPTLVVVLMSVLVALLIMALRQALITVLVIISPLALAAYLLPNTEKYGEKALNLFTTMLFMFPMLSVIFGGAQVAGTAIIQNADSINLIILGMAVQVAPVIVTPLLIRFSGALLSRIAGFVNNPNKGVIDRTRNWARERADQQKDKVLGNEAPAGVRGFAARRTKSIDAKRRDREGKQKMYQNYTDARWANDHRSHAIHEGMEHANMQKEAGESLSHAATSRQKLIQGSDLQLADVHQRVAKLDADTAKTKTDVQFDNLRANFSDRNPMPTDRRLGQAAVYAQQLTQESMVASRQLHGAQQEHQQNFADALKNDATLRQVAGGIGEQGDKAAFASAITATRKAWAERTNDSEQLLKHFNPAGADRQKLALGAEDIPIIDSATGQLLYTFSKGDIHAREAAIEAQLAGAGNFKEINEIITNSGGTLGEFKTTIKDAMVSNKLGEKAPWFSGKTIDDVAQGKISAPEHIDEAIRRTIGQGKIRPDHWATMDVEAAKRLFKVARDSSIKGVAPEDVGHYDARIADLGANAKTALTNPSLLGRIPNNVRDVLREMVREWPPPDSN